jgi:hypothetical protein
MFPLRLILLILMFTRTDLVTCNSVPSFKLFALVHRYTKCTSLIGLNLDILLTAILLASSIVFESLLWPALRTEGFEVLPLVDLKAAGAR